MDNRTVSQLVSKIISSKDAVTYPQNEEEIMEKTKDFVRYTLLDDKIEPLADWLQEDLLFNIIKRYKCDFAYANAIFSNLEKLGLSLCSYCEPYEQNGIIVSVGSIMYNILRFAEMRSFLSEKEIHYAAKRIDDNLKEKHQKK